MDEAHLLARLSAAHELPVVQEQEDAFTSFDFVVDPDRKVLSVTSMENVRGLTFDLSSGDFDSSNRLEVQLSSADGTGHIVSIMGLDDQPALVTRNGLGALERCSALSFPTWCYDESTEVLTLIEPSGTPGHWEITTQ